MIRFAVSLVVVVTSLGSTLSAQSLNFADFSNVSAFALNANAAQNGNELRVAPLGAMSKGSVYFSQPLIVANGFDTTFDFRMTPAAFNGGSGMTFIIHNDPAGTTAIGDHAWAMGYAGFPASPTNGIDNSLVLELDTFMDTSPTGMQNDPSSSHISLHTNGVGDNTAQTGMSLGFYDTTPVGSMDDGNVHTVRIVYVPGTIEVYYDNSASPVISATYDFATGGTWALGGTVGGLNLLPNGTAYVGWTAVDAEQHRFQPAAAGPRRLELDVDLDLAGGLSGQRRRTSRSSVEPERFSSAAETAASTPLHRRICSRLTYASPGGTLDGQLFGAVATMPSPTGTPPAGVPLALGLDRSVQFYLVGRRIHDSGALRSDAHARWFRTRAPSAFLRELLRCRTCPSSCRW